MDDDIGVPVGPLATHEDLESRWHALTNEERLLADELLADASEIIRNRLARYAEAASPDWWRSHRRMLTAVCCQMARTAMQQQVAGVPSGVSQASETTGPFTTSYSWSSPDGYLRFTDDMLRMLGLGGQRAFSIDMAGGEVHG